MKHWKDAAVICASIALALATFALPPPAEAAGQGAAVVPDSACQVSEVPRNDDASSPEVRLPFTIDFAGRQRTSLWINNNGNVTFDQPQRTYTPYGLEGTDREIIAPFFADVDTRSPDSDTVKYGWGTGIFDNRPTFCVNWVNVGYFSASADKTNSFQLLLVDRSDEVAGAFDIIFNYDRIQWETGNASGGSAGLGGTSAVAGFSNGTNSYFELPGSGVPGSFLDGSPEGLARNSLGSSTAGRYVFRVRNGGVAATKYVALGDSFQSGEGAFSYLDGTDTASNRCHRAPTSYPAQLVSSGAVRLDLDFGACSGAVIGDLYQTTDSDGNGPPYTDGAQLDRLGPDTRLVTLGISGNDLGFANVLTYCSAINNADLIPEKFIKLNFPGVRVPTLTSTCQQDLGVYVAGKLLSMRDSRSSSIGGRLDSLYREVRRRAPYARVVVVNYPTFFKEPSFFGRLGACLLNQDRRIELNNSDAAWLNDTVRTANTLIDARARAAGFEVADVSGAFAGHHLCTQDPAMNGISFNGREPARESFHPNRKGQELLTAVVTRTLDQTITPSFRLRQGQTHTATVNVVNPVRFIVNLAWPGSDVQTTLVSPSGREYTRANSPQQVEAGPTWERFVIDQPEPGTWTIRSFGAQMADDGEDVVLDAFDQPVENAAPTATLKATVSADTVTLDARTSSDPEGGRCRTSGILETVPGAPVQSRVTPTVLAPISRPSSSPTRKDGRGFSLLRRP